MGHFCFQNTFYKLDVNSYHGNGGDALTSSAPNNGMAFSTHDQDHDKWSSSCVDGYGGGGWWFNKCGYTNLNGYNYGHAKISSESMNWYKFGNTRESLKTITMAIRPIEI